MLRITSKLVENSKKAFPLHPVPQNVLQNEKDNSEFSYEIRVRFESKSWDLLDIEDWINVGTIETIASYFLPRAFHYYLPSILCLSIVEINYIDWGLKALLPHNQSREPRGDWWKEFYSYFTLDQKDFVREYLVEVLELAQSSSEEEFLAQIALEKIWN